MANAGVPLSYLSGFGSKAYPVTSLTWGLLIISIVVCVIITALVVVGTWARRSRITTPADMPPAPGAQGVSWITIGVGISTVALLGSMVWTVVVLAAINGPPSKPGPGLTLEVTGQQWWWKARYLSDDASRVLTTANEFHIPTGVPVRIKLISADVIHSFWVPALSGKTDTIPGQTNVTWIEANTPGRYEGQCTQYCGAEHGHMQFYVVAESPAQFQGWLAAQLKPATAPESDGAKRGEKLFVFHCGACHTVRGTMAGGSVAPDLTHLMSRKTIASGELPNTLANLEGWVADPQAIKPGTLMPTLYLSGPELTDIGAYLTTLN
jgi:cytochrome c oxidase subunit II